MVCGGGWGEGVGESTINVFGTFPSSVVIFFFFSYSLVFFFLIAVVAFFFFFVLFSSSMYPRPYIFYSLLQVENTI